MQNIEVYNFFEEILESLLKKDYILCKRLRDKTQIRDKKKHHCSAGKLSIKENGGKEYEYKEA